MKLIPFLIAVAATCLCSSLAAEDSPLRIFIRAGAKSHGPGAHDYPQFLKDWVPMLEQRGAKVEGGLEFPSAEQLARTDVLILHSQAAGNIPIGPMRKNLEAFIARGGGLVVIHAAAVSNDHEWFKRIIGGSWKNGTTRWLEAPMSLYFTDRDNPITREISNFDIDDEIYYDMDLLPEARILAAAYTPNTPSVKGGNKEAQQRAAEAVAKKKAVNIYDIQPQMWTYQKDKYRAFTCIPGHYYRNFGHNGLRACILRGIAWAGKRSNTDEFLRPEEKGDALRYVEGGCPSPKALPTLLEVHPQFDLSLVASEPLIEKPMNVDWDSKGRLWVVETPEYPNGLRQSNVADWMDSGALNPGRYQRKPQDRISILSDQNGDGVMDQKQVFADELELATSSVFYKTGVIVAAAPDIWLLEDLDGDERAEKRSRLYTNLGNRDTHAVINNLRWGPDGWIYATHGYSSTDDARSGDGSKHFGPIGSGVVRFKPDGSAFEQYASRGGNTWGLDITKSGEVFYTQPTSGNHFIHVILPEWLLARGKLPGVSGTQGLLPREPTHPAMHWEQQAYVQIDQVGSYTAAAGCAIYEGGAWPASWNHGYFTTEPTLNIVSHFQVEPDGVTYRAKREAGREQTEFIRSKNLWFRPIEVRVGPDGALYVVDFCNQAVIHNDTRGPVHGPANAAVRPDRDHYYGRIWRVQHKQAKPAAPNAYRHAPMQASGSVGSKAQRTYEAALSNAASPEGRGKIFAQFAAATDDWTRSALIAACRDHAGACIADAIAHQGPSLLVQALLPLIQATETAGLIQACATAPDSSGETKTAVLNHLAQQPEALQALGQSTMDALIKLLAQPGSQIGAYRLASQIKGHAALESAMAPLKQEFMTSLRNPNEPVARRLEICRTLSEQPEVAVFIQEVLRAKDSSAELKRGIIEMVSEGRDSTMAALVDAIAVLDGEPRNAAFEALLKRPEATRALLGAVENGKVAKTSFSPGDQARLRAHPNKALAKRALALFSIDNRAKDAIIAKLAPEVEKPGDAAKGKMLFGAACAVCHKLGDMGAAVGPPLDGMGAHGPAELLVHIVDPNREVDPSFWAIQVTTRKGELVQGVVTSENNSTLTLATQAGKREVPKAEIDKRENTHRSLMPEGLDALGAEALRDILAFICGDALRQFRILNLNEAFTADSRSGVFAGPEPRQGQVRLAKFGTVKVEGVPFLIADPAKSAIGTNLVVLKGGPSPTQYSQQFPASVEFPAKVAARRLHLLSGISGWGWPAVSEASVALQVRVHHQGGKVESFDLINGVHFSDYIRPVDVPGSKMVEDFSDGQQLRLITLELRDSTPIERLQLISPKGNRTAPVVVAITADIEGRGPKALSASELSPPSAPKRQPKKNAATQPQSGPKEGGKGDGPLQPTAPVRWEAGKTRVLVIGGGSSHNFAKFFGGTDVATLREAGLGVHYTEDRDQAASELANADVALISVNRRFFDTAAYREALLNFAQAGKGIVMLHPGTWYGFTGWPELNAQIVGGGARSHDRIHPFEVRNLAANHPVMKGLPAMFVVEDELYHVNAEPPAPGTAAIEVLAETSPSDRYQKSHPSVWITRHPKSRILGIALGHDQRVHDLLPFKQLLVQGLRWASGKP
jgi:putative membrane-bound dehydrogenase-like protein